MVSTLTRESELIICRECGHVFEEDEAEICHQCLEHICPKCRDCGCAPTPNHLRWSIA